MTSLGLQNDLSEIVAQLSFLMTAGKRKRVLITGGTGFFGKWLLASVCALNDAYQLDWKVSVLSRDPKKFLQAFPYFADRKELHWLTGDVRDFNFRVLPHVDFVIHAATDASDKLNKENPQLMYQTILDGTTNLVNFARTAAVERFLNISSGAVYGTQPQALSHFPETHDGTPLGGAVGSAYGLGKLAAEKLASQTLLGTATKLVTARCFAFVGPFLPLDTHFAVGNFILDGLLQRPIQILGDGLTRRSYMYPTDLVAWLFTLLFNGEPFQAYNVGSDDSRSLKEIADAVAGSFSPPPEVRIGKTAVDPGVFHQYIPSVAKAKSELNLQIRVPLNEAIRRTVEWHHMTRK